MLQGLTDQRSSLCRRAERLKDDWRPWKTSPHQKVETRSEKPAQSDEALSSATRTAMSEVVKAPRLVLRVAHGFGTLFPSLS